MLILTVHIGVHACMQATAEFVYLSIPAFPSRGLFPLFPLPYLFDPCFDVTDVLGNLVDLMIDSMCVCVCVCVCVYVCIHSSGLSAINCDKYYTKLRFVQKE